jgi:hypothetical protein
VFIPARILTIRGQKIMIDTDLAELYGVPTKRFSEQAVWNKTGYIGNGCVTIAL